MVRKLGFLALVLMLAGIARPGDAADRPGSISGFVRNSTGIPQMGATVEILSAAVHNLKVFTDENGHYSIVGLLPGTYSLKVSAPSFLPSLREKIGLRPGTALSLDVTLNTLFEAMQLGPLRGPAEDDDWKWTLRSVANRPILRVLDDGTEVAESRGEVLESHDKSSDHDLKASLSFVAGSASEGYGSFSDMSTGFSVEHPVLDQDTVALQGNVGYGVASPPAVMRASFAHKTETGSEPTVSLTFRRLAPPGPDLRIAGLQSVGLTTTDNLTVGNVLELKFGSELQTIQFMGRVTSFRPFGTADLHLSPNTVLEYRYASARPGSVMAHDEGMSNADLGESAPRVSIASYSPALERAHHQEVSVSHRFGNTNLQLAGYTDRINNTVLTGVGTVSAMNGEMLPDVESGTFSYQGRDLDTAGLRLVLQRKLRSDLTATLDYGYGGVLDLKSQDVELEQARESMVSARRHALSAKLSGNVPHCKTHWGASYGWVSGRALTPVDMFNASAGQSDPYLNVFIRQPLPGIGFLPIHMEAMLDLRNLLAQGYVPVMGQDGRTVYLVQSARSVRGGVAFTF
jgi:hypothetical protein